MTDKIFCLIKFGERPYMERLLKYGELFFNTSAKYNELHKDENERGHINEGARWVENALIAKVEADHLALGKFTFKPVQSKLSKLIQYNYFYLSYSLYAISHRTFENSNIHKIDSKILEFGDAAIFIQKPYKFLTQLKENSIRYDANFVEYVDLDKKGKINLSPFDKKMRHYHQMEFRIIIEDIDDKLKIINIGSIEN